MSTNELFIVLPYLKTSSPVMVRGIQFRSSDDIDFLPKETQEALKAIFSVFFLRDNLRIKRMTYAYISPDSAVRKSGYVLQRLKEAQDIITICIALLNMMAALSFPWNIRHFICLFEMKLKITQCNRIICLRKRL